ncbi:MAG: Wzz/FepE/Etk N-terminal domain-containing protein, partial [Candidatus Omnitrophota bacterium]
MEEALNQYEMTLRDYLRVLFRQKAVILAVFITVMITVFIGLKLKTPVYEAQVKMLISAEKQVESPYYRDLTGGRSMEAALTQSEVVISNPVIERAVKAVALYQRPFDYEKSFSSRIKRPLIAYQAKQMDKKLANFTEKQQLMYRFRLAVEDLKQHVEVEPVRDTNVFLIKVKDHSPIGAAVLANVVSRSYIIFDLEQQLAEMQLKYGEKHLSVKQLKDSIAKMAESLNGETLPDIEAIGPASVKIIEQASVPMRPSGVSKTLTFLLAVFMSIFLGIMLAFTFEYMDQTFRTPQDIERYLNIPFLGAIPIKASLSAYDNLADQVYLLLRDKHLKTVLLTAALPREGVTTIIANLGKNLATKKHHKVLVIDANLRNPSLHTVLKASNDIGLGDILEGKLNFEKAVKDLGAGLTLLCAGKTDLNPITLLESHKMEELMKYVRDRYDAVLVDCADLRDYQDAHVLAEDVDGVIVT